MTRKSPLTFHLIVWACTHAISALLENPVLLVRRSSRFGWEGWKQGACPYRACRSACHPPACGPIFESSRLNPFRRTPSTRSTILSFPSRVRRQQRTCMSETDTASTTVREWAGTSSCRWSGGDGVPKLKWYSKWRIDTRTGFWEPVLP